LPIGLPSPVGQFDYFELFISRHLSEETT